MRYITVPPPVTLEHANGPQPKISFADFIRKTLTGDQRVTKDDASVGKWMEVTDSVKDLKPGDVWELSGEAHEFLSDIARTFPNYHPEGKLYLLPLIKAITGAPDKKPEAANGKAEPKEGETTTPAGASA